MSDSLDPGACYDVTPNHVEYEPEDGEYLALATFWDRASDKMVTLARSTRDDDDDGVEICLGNQVLQHVTTDLAWRFEAGDLVISFARDGSHVGGYTWARIRLDKHADAPGREETLESIFRGFEHLA